MTGPYMLIAVGIVVGGLLLLMAYVAANEMEIVSNDSTDDSAVDLDNENLTFTAANGQFTVTTVEVYLVARILDLECGIDGTIPAKAAVASVIYNRVTSKHWGETVQQVIYSPNAFTSAKYIDDEEEVSEASVIIALRILRFGPILPPDVMYFRDDHDFEWEGYEHYGTYDNMYFGRFTNGDW